jgi:hypothetical protein
MNFSLLPGILRISRKHADSLSAHFFFATESEPYVTTEGQSASLTWNTASIWGLGPDLYYCQTVAGLLMWGALYL